MDRINYDKRKFRTISNTSSGQVTDETVFTYHQRGDLVWAEYSGGGVSEGFLVAASDEKGNLEMRYRHIDSSGAVRTGKCRSAPELLPDGRIRVLEKWQWTCGDRSDGESILEEIT